MSGNLFITKPPYNLIYKMDSGAYQEIFGEIQDGVWVPLGEAFYVKIYYNEHEYILKEIKERTTLARYINGNMLNEKIKQGDYANLPTRTGIEQKSIEDLLLSLEVIQIELDPNVIINGQPHKKVQITPEYRMIYPQDTFYASIDVTDTANPRKVE